MTSKTPLTSDHLSLAHGRVILREVRPADGLLAGMAGTVVHIYKDRATLEVEFLPEGRDPVVATVGLTDIQLEDHHLSAAALPPGMQPAPHPTRRTP